MSVSSESSGGHMGIYCTFLNFCDANVQIKIEYTAPKSSNSLIYKDFFIHYGHIFTYMIKKVTMLI